MKKYKFLLHWWIFFNPFFKVSKAICQRGKTSFFFIRNLRALHLLFAGNYIRIWGHLYSAGIALQLYSAQIWKAKKSSKIEGNTLGILRRSFFPFNALGMPSFNNSVLFHVLIQLLCLLGAYQTSIVMMLSLIHIWRCRRRG